MIEIDKQDRLIGEFTIVDRSTTVKILLVLKELKKKRKRIRTNLLPLKISMALVVHTLDPISDSKSNPVPKISRGNHRLLVLLNNRWLRKASAIRYLESGLEIAIKLIHTNILEHN